MGKTGFFLPKWLLLPVTAHGQAVGCEAGSSAPLPGAQAQSSVGAEAALPLTELISQLG